MKKFLSLLFIMIFFAIPVFAEYKPIPQKYIKKYKEEINNKINYQIPVSKKEVKDVINEIKSEQNEYVRSYLIIDGINVVLFSFYMELINVTDKYVNIKSSIPPTDGYGVLKELITPYLNDNKINTSKIDNFLNYCKIQQTKLEKQYNY